MTTKSGDTTCTDPVILDMWHPVAAMVEVTPNVVHKTLLLGETIGYTMSPDAEPVIWRAAPDSVVGEMIDPDTVVDTVPARLGYGYLWASLGSPPDRLFEIPEFDEPDRRILNAGSIMVATSAPRAIENFLDMGHFPYVHTDILGVEPHTEVVEYNVEITDDNEVLATRCEFWQPAAAASATDGQLTEYTYRVPHPYCVMLYKSVPSDPSRRDAIGLFVQAMTEESVRAHNFLCMVDTESSEQTLKHFQQLIFGQDKPILENQQPKRLPLDPRAETPIRADKSSITYRRWLRDLGVDYAVIPAS